RNEREDREAERGTHTDILVQTECPVIGSITVIMHTLCAPPPRRGSRPARVPIEESSAVTACCDAFAWSFGDPDGPIRIHDGCGKKTSPRGPRAPIRLRWCLRDPRGSRRARSRSSPCAEVA